MVTRTVTVRFTLVLFGILLALVPLAAVTAQAVGTPEGTGDDELDLASLDGVQRAVTRFYSGEVAFFGTPEPTSAGTAFIVALVIEFDQDAYAATALRTINDDVLASVTADPTFTVDEVDAGALGQQTAAYTATGEEAGTPTEISLVLTQDGSFVYLVAAVGYGDAVDSIGTATAVVQTMVDSEAGEGDGAFDAAGASTGGLWDKLPAEGDAVLQGLTAESDEVLYPPPADGA